MPFGNPDIDPQSARMLELLYMQWIKPAIESIQWNERPEVRIECHRADKTERSGEIITHIIDQLVTADIVIADLSGQNPNVFYELGVRHAVHNNTILIAQNIKDIPFDLRHLRTIQYNYDPEGMLIFRDRLINAIRAIEKDMDAIDNPVRRYLSDKAVNGLIKQEMRFGPDNLREMAVELVSLRREFASYAAQMRDVIESITTTNSENRTDKAPSVDSLKEFEGIWISDLGTMACVRVLNGQLYIPYSYHSQKTLTGHYFDCSVKGNILVGKFEWFEDSISGYAYFTKISDHCLEGGWWYSHDVPLEFRQDPSSLNEAVPGMQRITYRKNPQTKFPHWAETYFECRLFER
jgi:hypothetical protein